ncbi:stalk domain-containing protein [Cohnella sp. AR92]|uniref:stalk domain-containing protein n=1 Tax=Cohnella sp. AR92 TaxID=648716 RepID=UPI000F8C4325|nr:stalk domain-containing protein [Cohnella sp. AR92]RUS45987.1 hypothetical protein ELR57_16175 [Cohnella sp. AR92]
MGKRLKRWLVPSVAALLAVVPAGCEAVNGLDMNKVLVERTVDSNAANPNASISMSIGLDLQWNDALLNVEGEDEADVAMQKKWLDWFSKTTFKLNELRTDEEGRILANGVFSFGKGNISFQLHADESHLLFEVEGAKRPLVIDLDEPLKGSMAGESPLLALQRSKEGESLIRTVASYFVGNLPNPPKIDAKSASVEIHGTKTDVTQVHAELNGKQLGELIPAYLDALVKDESGLRKMVGEVTDWFAALPPEMKESLELDDLELPSKDEFEETVQEMADSFKEAKKELDSERADNEDEWNAFFNEKTTLSADLYVDSDLKVRKLAADLHYSMPTVEEEEMALPLTGFTIRLEQENWTDPNASPISNVVLPPRVLNVDDLMEMTSLRGLRLFENDSVIYDLLKNDFSVDDASFEVYPKSEEWASNWGLPSYREDKNGKILISLRGTLNEFEDNVVYRGGHLVFYDEGTYQEVALTVGSNKIKVNGVDKTWSQPVVTIDGTAYAYADDLLGLLGAKYSLDDETSRLLIERDL